MNVYKNQQEIEIAIEELAHKIDLDYRGKKLVLVCVVKGAMVFFAKLMLELNKAGLDFEIETIRAKRSYDSETVAVNFSPTLSITNKHVLIVDGICDTGLTAKRVEYDIEAFMPTSINFCFLLDKNIVKKHSLVNKYYKCFDCPDEFMVGYGLDDNEKKRGWPFIYAKKPDVAEE